MVTGASHCDAAVILVDARKGLLAQTLRHTRIVQLLGIRHVLVAINKMDLVGFDQARFEALRAEYATFVAPLKFESVTALPVAARGGDNVVTRSRNMPWHPGGTLLDWLESVATGAHDPAAPLRMPVQWVNRPHQDLRGLCGTIVSGKLERGATIAIAPGQRRATVARIFDATEDLDVARAGAAVTVVLDEAIDTARGDVLAADAAPPESADQFAAHVVWMSEHDLMPGRAYLLRQGTVALRASVTALRHRLDIVSGEQRPARALHLNDIGFAHLQVERPIAFDAYAASRELGGFVLIDLQSQQTVAAGVIAYPLHRAANLRRQAFEVDRALRAAQKHQRPCVVWLTGLSGAGKSTIANLVERELAAAGAHTYLLDGDNLRHGLNRDLGFTEADRVENIRRAGEVARLMVDAGLIVLCSFISPFRAERRAVRELFAPGEFIEVFVDAPLAVAEARDVKGLYRRARLGQIPNFTGIDSPYEPPERAEVVLDTAAHDAAESAGELLAWLRERAFLA